MKRSERKRKSSESVKGNGGEDVKRTTLEAAGEGLNWHGTIGGIVMRSGTEVGLHATTEENAQMTRGSVRTTEDVTKTADGTMTGDEMMSASVTRIAGERRIESVTMIGSGKKNASETKTVSVTRIASGTRTVSVMRIASATKTASVVDVMMTGAGGMMTGAEEMTTGAERTMSGAAAVATTMTGVVGATAVLTETHGHLDMIGTSTTAAVAAARVTGTLTAAHLLK